MGDQGTGRLANLNALVTGIIGDRSIAYAIAKAFKREGANLIISTANNAITERVAKKGLLEDLGNPTVTPCNVASTDEIRAMVASLPKLDILVHAIAFADRDAMHGRVTDVGDQEFEQALIISALSLQRLMRELQPLFNPNFAVITLDYLGGERVVPAYGMMGPVKSLLGGLVKYLAWEAAASPLRGRVNVISPGPIETTAARAIGDFKGLFNQYPKIVPTGRNVGIEEVAEVAVMLASSEATSIIGETIHIDGGAHTLGLTFPSD